MTIEFKILKQLDLVIIFSTNEVTDQDVYQYLAILADEEDFSSHFHQLSDARFITENRVTHAGLMYAAKATPLSEGSKNAIIIKRDIEKGRANQFGAYSTETDEAYLVTADLEYGISWLGYSGENEILVKQTIENYHATKN